MTANLPSHAEDDDDRRFWVSGPDEAESVYVDADTAKPIETKISPDYRQFECAGCTHVFWAWMRNMVTGQVVCPKCKLPLGINFEAVTIYKKKEG